MSRLTSQAMLDALADLSEELRGLRPNGRRPPTGLDLVLAAERLARVAAVGLLADRYEADTRHPEFLHAAVDLCVVPPTDDEGEPCDACGRWADPYPLELRGYGWSRPTDDEGDVLVSVCPACTEGPHGYRGATEEEARRFRADPDAFPGAWENEDYGHVYIPLRADPDRPGC